LNELLEVVEDNGFKIDIKLHGVVLTPQPDEFVEVPNIFRKADALLGGMSGRKVHTRGL
jgi:hypothetical protein